jgi:hypothetical protein
MALNRLKKFFVKGVFVKVNDMVKVISDVSKGSIGVVEGFDNGKVFVWFDDPVTVIEDGIKIDNVYEISVLESELCIA